MLSPRLWPEAAVTLARTFGWRGALYRVHHELRRRQNRFLLHPRHHIESADPGRRFLKVDRSRLIANTDHAAAVERADRIVNGEYQAYRARWQPLPHISENWLRHPVSGVLEDAGRPWWTVEHLPAAGDIKDLWEPARFGWVYDLVRAYLITDDERYARAFSSYFLSWAQSSPPFRGVHWSCGQESSIRAVALLYAEANFDAELLERGGAGKTLCRVLGATGERIADAIGYAISQRNNHAISEAAGLVALGVRLRGVHPDAQRWIDDGALLLSRLIMEQFADDGWYIQHSFSYLRLAIDQCVIAEMALRSIGSALPVRAVDRLRAAVRLLTLVMDDDSGLVPNHGHSDGAFVHPITLGAYRDFRAVVTAASALWNVAVPSSIDVDDEVLAWLDLEDPTRCDPIGDGVHAGASGWAVARVGGSAVFLRAGRYSSRPAHLDPLHLDIRMNGREVIVDPGTFAYNAPPPWRNPLTRAAFHNGPLVDGREPGIRGPRFLWYVWPSARITSARFDGQEAIVTAELDGQVRRTIRVRPGSVAVRDEPIGDGVKTMSVCWLIHPDVDPSVVQCDGEMAVDTAAPETPEGWFSPAYGVKQPSVFVRASVNGAGSVLNTRVSAPGQEAGCDAGTMLISETNK